ncbi:MAG: bifunctional methionine sulfoxide reductase B/A protein [Phycisphaera sp.]|nr:bifunctional methionine sulfoxide reductase B/A protein [Phycisphaera sp.]
MVSVKVFNDQGELVGPFEMAKVVKSDDEWKTQLGDEAYRILRNKGTEAPFCGTLLDNKKEGVYVCAGCDLPLFTSGGKFHSGTGWPSFFQPIAKENIVEKSDTSHGMVRTEILCARCDGHLGHVFEDGPRPTGLRYCVNGESLKFVDQDKLATLADPATKQAAAAGDSELATAVLAGGCFWCTEAVFEPLKGVVSVESGYSGGSKETANYPAVCTGTTGHAEAIRITYDPRKISYEKLLKIFFTVAHDPTTLNRQGADEGTQYRSAIFYANENEKSEAQAMIQHLSDSGEIKGKIVTTLEPLKAFYPAEKYHQDYAKNNPDQPYIRAAAQPKVEKLQKKYGDELK